MVAADRHRRLQLAIGDHLVEGQAEAMALPQADPADARRQSLEVDALARNVERSEEHTSELQSLMRNSYTVFCLKKKQNQKRGHQILVQPAARSLYPSAQQHRAPREHRRR